MRRGAATRSFLHVASALQRAPARECLDAFARILAWRKENCSTCGDAQRTHAASLQLNRYNERRSRALPPQRAASRSRNFALDLPLVA
jgi:hypothetical protein